MNSDKLTKGLQRAPHRSLLYALGLDKQDFKRYKIGIVSAQNNIIPGHMHLKDVVRAVEKGVNQADGVAFDFNTIGVCDGLAMNHEGMKASLPTREIIADSIEASVLAFGFDGLVFVPNCDKVVPGMLMAAGRVNLPSIFVSGGPMISGRFEDQNVSLTNVFEAVGKVQAGEMSEEQLDTLERNACPSCGSCSGMFTANTMNCLCEALGIAPKDNGTLPSVYSQRYALATQVGRQIVKLVEQDVKFKDIVTKEALMNAVCVDMALGGSTNTALHLPAIAYECGYELDLKDFDTYSKKVPQLVKLAPATTLHIEDFYHNGGVYLVMKKLFDNNLLFNCKNVYNAS